MIQFMPEKKYPEADFTTNEKIEAAIRNRTVLAYAPYRCDSNGTLHFKINGVDAKMPHGEIAYPEASSAAAVACVGRKICFVAVGFSEENDGKNVLYLSRAIVQRNFQKNILSEIETGTVIPCVVTKIDSYGAFCDIGCGVSALLHKSRMSTSRIQTPQARMSEGDEIYAVISEKKENGMVNLSMKELLGTWEQNVSGFQDGDVVTGIVRGVQDYGVFIEIAPNLSGLAENVTDLRVDDVVSVRISRINPEKMKLKLHVLAILNTKIVREPLKFYIKDGVIKKWKYSPDCCAKTVESVF